VPLSFKEVAEILKIIDASQCEEVVLELGDIRLVVRRSSDGGAVAATGAERAVLAAARDSAARPAREPAPSPAPNKSPAVAPAIAPGRIEIRAPMVGTFYRRPSPRDPPFVEVGQKIKRGAPLCLIEVMKLYTTIEAQADGEIEQIAAEDGTLVEFDQLLFVVKPA
jgi:acetyl-CoA carboxylase biotin carboxyl carrier protein